MLQLFWKDDLLDTPFFKVQSARMSEDRIETANAFSKRYRAWGLRAGYLRPPTGHDFRAEGLYWVGKSTMPPALYWLTSDPKTSSTPKQREWSMLDTRTRILFVGTTCLLTAQMGRIRTWAEKGELSSLTSFVA